MVPAEANPALPLLFLPSTPQLSDPVPPFQLSVVRSSRLLLFAPSPDKMDIQARRQDRTEVGRIRDSIASISHGNPMLSFDGDKSMRRSCACIGYC